MNKRKEIKSLPSELELRVSNFRSIRSATFRLQPGLNVLIGPNGSGKTNILSALKFIRDTLTLGVALAMGKAGGAPKNYFRGSHEIEFEIIGYYDFCKFRKSKVPFKFQWKIVIAQQPPDQIASIIREEFKLFALVDSVRPTIVLDFAVERLQTKKPRARTSLRHEEDLGKDFFRQFDGTLFRRNKVDLFTEFKKKISRSFRKSKNSPNHSCLPALLSLHPRISEVASQLISLNEYNIDPEAARKPTDRVPEARMEANGSGLSEVIHALRRDEWHRIAVHRLPIDERFEEYPYRWPRRLWSRYHWRIQESNFRSWKRKPLEEEALSSITQHLTTAVNSVKSISTEIDPSNGRRYVVFFSGGHKFLPQEVSDGTIKWLCLLVSLFIPFSKTYLLEEPENFMHPWMQQRLVQIMREQAVKENLMFIVTTHSVTLLNSLQPEELLLVNYTEGATHVSSFKDTDEVRHFLAKSQFGLGDLWVSGGVGAVPSGESK